MRTLVFSILTLALALVPDRAVAIEGGTIAGVAGGSDIRSALPAPPGLYVAGALALSQTESFYDGGGRAVPALADLWFEEYIGAVGALYVP